jgi:hypothetical protein
VNEPVAGSWDRSLPVFLLHPTLEFAFKGGGGSPIQRGTGAGSQGAGTGHGLN